MGFSTLFGAGVGVVIKFTSNSIRRLPLYRGTWAPWVTDCLDIPLLHSPLILSNSLCTEPWDYPLFILVGAYAGYKYPQIEERMLREVNEKRARLDQAPIELKATFDMKKWE